MATTKQVNDFINKIGPLVQKYAKANGYKVASPIIAQACYESGYGTTQLSSKYNNHFGMKCGSKWTGKSVNCKTKEEYQPGVITNISANFRVYNTFEEGVKGYFDFVSSSRYANLKTATSYTQYLNNIKADAYCTDNNYVINCSKIVVKYNLTKFDNFNETPVSTVSKATATYYPKYTGSSTKIDEIFKAIGVPDKYRGKAANRKPVAEANGVKNYSGTSTQNLSLIKLAKTGTLKKV